MSRGVIRIFPDHETLSKVLAETIVQRSHSSIVTRKVFDIALSGGGTPKNLYRLLASSPYIDRIHWEKVRFFWGDERLVPPDHPESNYGQVYEQLLQHVNVTSDQIFRIRGELGLEEAVADYSSQLAEASPDRNTWPRFDVVLLGLGEDGHVASIFPGPASEQELQAPVIATKLEYQDRPVERVTLTPMVFNTAREIFYLVVGEGKAGALARVFSDEEDLNKQPAVRIRPESGRITWFIDEAAGSLLSKDLKREWNYDH
ncbi:MAG: 6-phosphogluconolactonase [Anaerolineales bacterium]|nr:6-phosphogluconolactonase [Anaerolineales bacterium]